MRVYQPRLVIDIYGRAVRLGRVGMLPYPPCDGLNFNPSAQVCIYPLRGVRAPTGKRGYQNPPVFEGAQL